MAELFVSFSTSDKDRVQPFVHQLRADGFSVFWSPDIPIGAPNYQDVLIQELDAAKIVIVVWTEASVKSHPVRQECAQAQNDNKLVQVLLDPIRAIELPMEASFGAQKALLYGWANETDCPQWLNLIAAIQLRLGRSHSKTPNAFTKSPAPHRGGQELEEVRKAFRTKGPEAGLLRGAELAVAKAQKDFHFAERLLDKLLTYPELDGQEASFRRGQLLFDSVCRGVENRVNEIVRILERHPKTDIWPWIEEMIIV